MKKYLLLLLTLALTTAFAADKQYAVGQNDLEISGSFSILKDLAPANYQLLRATNRRTVFSVLVKKYPGQKKILFNTVRYFQNGKPFVIEYTYAFETGKQYKVDVKFIKGKAELFLDGELMKSKPYNGSFLNGSMRNAAKDPVTFTLDQVQDGSKTAPAEKKK